MISLFTRKHIQTQDQDPQNWSLTSWRLNPVSLLLVLSDVGSLLHSLIFWREKFNPDLYAMIKIVIKIMIMIMFNDSDRKTFVHENIKREEQA